MGEGHGGSAAVGDACIAGGEGSVLDFQHAGDSGRLANHQRGLADQAGRWDCQCVLSQIQQQVVLVHGQGLHSRWCDQRDGVRQYAVQVEICRVGGGRDDSGLPVGAIAEGPAGRIAPEPIGCQQRRGPDGG